MDKTRTYLKICGMDGKVAEVNPITGKLETTAAIEYVCTIRSPTEVGGDHQRPVQEGSWDITQTMARQSASCIGWGCLAR